MFRSIRWRLVFSFVSLTLLTVALVGVLALALIKQYISRQEVEQLTANAEAVARQATSLMWPVIRQRELSELAQTSAFLGNARVRILDSQRRVLADSEPSAEGGEFTWILVPHELWLEVTGGPMEPFIVELPTGRQLVVPSSWEEQYHIFEQFPSEAILTVIHWQDGAWGSGFKFDVIQRPEQFQELTADQQEISRSDRVVTVSIGETDSPLGYVEISHGPDFGAEALETTRRAFMFAAGGAMLIAVIVGLLVGRGLSSPLRRLAEVAGRMSGGDLSIRASVHGKDEIGQLAGQFNQMAERLEASFAALAAERDALRRFVADASHELRTPITALKNFNELLQGPAADDPAARAEFLAESQAQLERLEWITQNLLDLSRLDAGLVALEIDDHDVADLIETAAVAFKTVARRKGVNLSVEAPEPSLKLRCDRARVELALSNLMDNAVKFTPAGGSVQVGAETTGETVRLWVRDSGPGIEVADLPHIFDRFYRGQNNSAGGSGLGLAIVQSVVRAHKGRVFVESSPGEGARFVIELPVG
jgi:signal transduction histidine kinase